MKYEDLVVAVKWLLLFVASLALDNAFGTLYESSVKDHVTAVRVEVASAHKAGDSLESFVEDVCLYFPEEIIIFILLLYFAANMIRYFVSSFWEFIPLSEAGHLGQPVNLVVALRFGIFVTLQVMVIAWQGKALSDPFTFFYLLAFLFGTDILWGIVSGAFIWLFRYMRNSDRCAGVYFRHKWFGDAATALERNAGLALSWVRIATIELIAACFIVVLLEIYKSPFDHRHIADLAPVWVDALITLVFGALCFLTFWDFFVQREAYKKITHFLFKSP